MPKPEPMTAGPLQFKTEATTAVETPMREILTNVDKAIEARPIERTTTSAPAITPLFERHKQFEKRLLDFTGRVHTFVNTMLGPVDPAERMNDAGQASLVDIELDRIAEMEREVNRAQARLDELAARLGVDLK